MKRSLYILTLVLGYFLFSSVSCDDEPFVQVKGIETSVFNEIKAFRDANSIGGPFVHQFVMVQEAQLFSAKLSYSNTGLDTAGIATHWDIIHDKIGGINDLTLLQSTDETTAAGIVANWTQDSATSALLLGDFSQCGVGIESGPDQLAYVTVMLMLVE